MFTGLVETIGVLRRRAGSPVARAFIETTLAPLELGESIAVDGACLTVDRIVHSSSGSGFECDMSAETLARTTLGELPLGASVHLERSVPLGGRMGGHLVLGHVDAVGRVSAREPSGEAIRFEVTLPGELAELGGLVAIKGSIAIDGVSLTVNRVSDAHSAGSGDFRFDVMLVPHTIGRTLLVNRTVGASVNIEVDVLARYVARQLDVGRAASPSAASPPDESRLLEKLRSGGWM